MVKRQLEVGLDVIDDGEFGKTTWSQYVRGRLDGLEGRPRAIATDQVARGRDRERFPGFYAWADASKTLFGYMEDPYWLSFTATRPMVTGALRYRPEAVNRDIANLKAALADHPEQEAFLPVVAPASIEVGMTDVFYGSHDDLMAGRNYQPSPKAPPWPRRAPGSPNRTVAYPLLDSLACGGIASA